MDGNEAAERPGLENSQDFCLNIVHEHEIAESGRCMDQHIPSTRLTAHSSLFPPPALTPAPSSALTFVIDDSLVPSRVL